MAYYKVTMKQTWVWEVLVHANDAEEARKVVDACDWGEPVTDEQETISILELVEKPKEVNFDLDEYPDNAKDI
jgi:hypothetical protein